MTVELSFIIKRILKIFTVETIFSLFWILVFYFTSIKIQDYFDFVNTYSTQINELNSVVSSGANITTQSLDVLNAVNSATLNISFMIFVFLPLALILTYTIFQGLSFKLTYANFKEALKDKRYYLRFLIMTLFFGLFVFLALTYLTPAYNAQEVFGSEGALDSILAGSLILIVVVFIGFAIAVTYYALLKKNEVWTAVLSRTYEVLIERPSLIAYNLVYYLLALFQLMMMTALIIVFTKGEVLFFSLGANIISLLVTNLIISFYKVYLVDKINK